MRALRWVAWGAGALVLVTGVTTFAMWPRDDIPREPDAVVVLGGAGPERAHSASTCGTGTTRRSCCRRQRSTSLGTRG
jgi:hypothetical protein